MYHCRLAMIHFSFGGRFYALVFLFGVDIKEFGLLLDVGFFQSETLLAVNDLEEQTEEQSCHTETCEHDEGGCVVELCGVGDSRIGGVEYFTDEQREQPESDVLNPEDEGVG